MSKIFLKGVGLFALVVAGVALVNPPEQPTYDYEMIAGNPVLVEPTRYLLTYRLCTLQEMTDPGWSPSAVNDGRFFVWCFNETGGIYVAHVFDPKQDKLL